VYAVIQTGGKQYLVKKDDRLTVEKLPGEEGEDVLFNNVLLVGGETLKVGRPFVDGATVQAKIKEQRRAKKIIVYKKKRRKGYEVRKGHRQYITTIQVTDINI